MTVNILGNAWTIEYRTSKEDEKLNDCNGYCDWTQKLIVVECDNPHCELGKPERHSKKIKRHEIIHAFLFECGLANNTNPVDAWAYNEEMVDWFAWMGEKIYKAWEEADALD